jgi:hypothetical protein
MTRKDAQLLYDWLVARFDDPISLKRESVLSYKHAAVQFKNRHRARTLPDVAE